MNLSELSIFSLFSCCSLFAGESFTLSAWIRPKEVVPGAPIIVCASDGESWSDGFGLFLDDSGRLSSYVGSAENPADCAAGAVPARDSWQHVCLVFEDGVSRLYANGEHQGCATNGLDGVTYAENVFVGDDGYVSFDGEITLMDFLPEALSAEDVAAVWREAAAGAAAPPSAAPQPAEVPPAAPSASASDADSFRLAERLRNLGCVSTRQRPSPKPRLRVFTEFAR